MRMYLCMCVYVRVHVCVCMYVCTWLRCLGVVSALRWSTGQQSGDSMRMGGGECWGERAAQSPSDAGTEHRLGSREEGEGVWFVCPNGWPCGCRRLVSAMAKMAKIAVAALVGGGVLRRWISAISISGSAPPCDPAHSRAAVPYVDGVSG